jgi:hypothetical protein
LRIELKFCSIEWTDWGCLTRFPDGAEIGAFPHEIPHYYVISHRCGYGDDIMAYCREHDFSHSFVAERIRGGPSYVLLAMAHQEKVDMGAAVYEEIAAQTFQRFLRTNERPILSGVNWDKLKADALELLNAHR